jgi:mono/diheme cytochrome c family protein
MHMRAHSAARLRWGAGLALGGLLGLSLLASPASAQDQAQITAGMKIFRTKGDCQTCHGWAADGRKMDNQMPDGANLRETQLDREGLIFTIKCGRPGAGMPAFDRLAYKDDRCNGMKVADLQAAGLTMTDPANALQQREIEAVVAFLYAKVIGKGPLDYDKCVEYWGEPQAVCNEYKK